MTLKQGRVTSTKVEDGVCLVNVQLDRAGVEKRNIPILKPLSGVTLVPDEGDMVALDKLKGGREVVMGILNRAPYEQPDHNNDEFSFTLNEDTEFSFTKNGDGEYDVKIKCDGNVTVESDNLSVGSGSEDVVTNIETSTSDGYISDVSFETSDNLKVE